MLEAKWYRTVVKERKARVKDLEKWMEYSQNQIEFWERNLEQEKQWLAESKVALEQAIEWEKEYKAKKK